MTLKFQLRRHRTVLIIAASLLLLYLLLGFLILPWYAERQLVGTLQERLQVTASVEATRFNPFTFTASMENVQLTTAEGNPLLDLERLYFNFEPSRLFLRKVRFEELAIVTPQLYFNRFSETEDTFSRLAARWEATAPPEEAEAPDPAQDTDAPSGTGEPAQETELFPLEFGRFAYIEGSIHIHDAVPETDFNTVLSPVNLLVENFSTINEQERGSNELLVALENDARFRLVSNFIVSPLQWEGEMALENFSLLTPWRYYQDTAPFTLQEGRLDLSLAYNVTLPTEGLNLQLDNIQVRLSQVTAHETGQLPFLDGGSLSLSNGRVAYPSMRIAADELALADVMLRLVQNPEGQLNLTRIAAAIGDDEDAQEPEPEDEDESSLQLELARFTLSNSHVLFIDEMPATPAEFDITLNGDLEGFNLERNRDLPVNLNATLASGGALNLNGQLQFFPDLDLSTSLSLEALSLLPAQPYLSELANVSITDGLLHANARLESNAGEALAWNGDLSLTSLALQDDIREEQLLAWASLAFDNVAMSLAARSLEVSEVILDQPYARVVITEEATTNFAQVLRDDSGEQVADQATAAADQVEETADEEQQTGESFAIAVGRVVINEASSDFMDQNLPIVFDARMETLDGGFTGFSTESAQPTELNLEGQVDEFGLVEIAGSLTPLDFKQQTTVNMSFSNLDLAATSPYVIKFAGREIDDGSADLDLRYEIRGGELDAVNDIVIRDIELGAEVASEGALDLPLDMAVALLESSEGIIDLEIPVSGNVNDPQFDIGPIIRGALANSIGNIVTSPFRFLGGLVGGDEDEISAIGFRPGRSDLAPPEQQKLLRLSEALSQRPQLLLQLPAPVAGEQDREALQTSVVDARIEQAMASGEEPQSSATRLQVLESLYNEAALSPPLESLRLQFTEVPEAVDDDNEDSGDTDTGSTDGEAELLAILTFDTLAYTSDLRERLVAAESISGQQLRELAEARQQAAAEFLSVRGELDAARVQQGDTTEADVEDGWVQMAFELGVR